MFGVTKMNRNTVLNEIDAWVSMLENWADSVKEYMRECQKRDLSIAQCLPKMSKNLARMLDAMLRVRNFLPPNGKSGLAEIKDQMVRHWYTGFKRKVS